MKKQPPAWRSFLPGGLAPSHFSLDELRATKLAHTFLTEQIQGPEGLAYYVRGFRCLLFFGVACVSEDKYPPLTRCWKHLEKLFGNDPAFDDDVFIRSWILMDFPFGSEDQTALDYFQEFLEGTGVGPDLQAFIDEARRSRLSLLQDVLRTKQIAKFRELLTGRVISAFPSVEQYSKGEILLTRTLAYNDQVFIWGNPKGFPKEVKGQIEEMVRNKLFYFFEEGKSEVAQYEEFMKLAGPYWMSCVTKNDAVPILEPDQYRSYLREDE
ncbi:MAG: hypothetical protein ABIQ16_08875 [Polyangiaceae bacterium]